LIATVAEWATITDHGLFAAIASHDDSAQAVWLLQLFLAIAILGGLVAANQVAELSRAEAACRQSERAEREARSAAAEAQAAERSRLARELHDSVSQALFSMTMHARTAQIALARGAHPASGPLARAIDQLGDLTAGALAEMRALIFELRPGALAEEGLVAALVRQAAAISAREQIPITVDGPAERLPLTAPAEENSYRIVLEALHNAVKHAAATHAAVTVVPECPVVRITVADDGCGFDINAQCPGKLGLRTMAERADKIRGDLQVTTMPGAGTRIQLAVPAELSPPGKGG
jgi:signal transduction histidine kinase